MRWLDSITDSVNMSEQTRGIGKHRKECRNCTSWGRKESDRILRLNYNKVIFSAQERQAHCRAGLRLLGAGTRLLRAGLGSSGRDSAPQGGAGAGWAVPKRSRRRGVGRLGPRGSRGGARAPPPPLY